MVRPTLLTPVKALFRSQEIALTFVTSGLGGLLTSVGIEGGKRGLLWAGLRSQPPVELDSLLGQRLASTLIQLGPTFIKLGQMMASRPDAVGEPVAQELRVLFDRVPALPFRKIQKILNRELGKRRVSQSFKTIQRHSLASASLSQTHRAWLKSGEPVILKVQKPGVSDTVKLDLWILERFVPALNLAYPKWNISQMFQEFKAATLRELNYLEEAKNIDRFKDNYQRFLSKSDVIFPKYFAELTTEKVLTLEPMHGIKVTDLKKGSGLAARAATKGLHAVLEQIFDHGFFHADPHAGNLFFLADEGRVGLIDLGLVGSLHPDDKRKFLKVILAILQRDRGGLAKALYSLGTPSAKTDYSTFEKAIHQIIDESKKMGLNQIKIETTVNKLFAIARQNGLHIPNRYVLMVRSCLIIEGVAKNLDPGLSIIDIALPIVAKSLLKTYLPWRLLRKKP